MQEGPKNSKLEEDTAVIEVVDVRAVEAIQASEESKGSRDEDHLEVVSVIAVTVDVVEVIVGEDTGHLTNEAIEAGVVVEEDPIEVVEVAEIPDPRED